MHNPEGKASQHNPLAPRAAGYFTCDVSLPQPEQGKQVDVETTVYISSAVFLFLLHESKCFCMVLSNANANATFSACKSKGNVLLKELVKNTGI